MPAIPMKHDRDPREAIMEWAAPAAAQLTIPGPWVLVAVYQRPEQTAGGIILTRKNREEDNYQGIVGLVLKKGDLAFVDDDKHAWGDFRPEVGEFVLYRVGDTFGFDIPGGRENEKRTLRLVEDVSIKAILTQPDLVA